MKFMWMIVFFVLPFVGLGYVLWHIWQILPFTTILKSVVVAVCAIAFLSFFPVFFRYTDKLPLNTASLLYEIGTSSIFIMLYLLMLFLLADIACICHVMPKGLLHSNIYSSFAVLAIITAVFVYGNINYNNKKRVELPLVTEKNLGKDSCRIVLMSDLHLGYNNRRAEFAKWVEKVNAENPDFILIGGDIIDTSVKPLLEEGMSDEFKKLSAPIYACLGNHEYFSGRQRAIDFYRESGINLLTDSVANLYGVSIIGRDDASNAYRRSVADLTNDVLPGNFTILLDHQPYNLQEAEDAGVDFQFSGHTHRGQVWPISWITDMMFEDSYGKLQKGDTHYYVSSGIGIWGGKYRIGTCSEYVVVTLKKN